MAKTATISTAKVKKIVLELERLEEFKEQTLRLLPDGVLRYGSKLWWQKEVLNGEGEIKKGKVKEYKNARSLIADLHKGI